MKTSPRKQSALTLIEVMVAIVVVAVAVIGAMGYRYYCALDAKKADVQMNAARLCSLLLEDWKAHGGAATYDPTVSIPSSTGIFTISAPNGCPGPVLPTGFTSLKDCYWIVENGVNYYVRLSYKPATAPVPITLMASVGWKADYQTTGSSADLAKTVSMTTYSN